MVFERLGASPAAAIAVMQMLTQIDVSDILSSVHVPTLVIHCTGDPLINVECGRFLAERIPGARLLELPGHDHLFFIHEQMKISAYSCPSSVTNIPYPFYGTRRAEADNRYSHIADKSHRYRNAHLRPASKRGVF